MTIITENHPKWPLYSRLRKCGEITASTDGVHIGLNCSHCRSIFSGIDIKNFLLHQQEQHANALCSDNEKNYMLPTKTTRNTQRGKRKIPSPPAVSYQQANSDLDCDDALRKRPLRNVRSSAVVSNFEAVPLEITTMSSSTVLKDAEDADFDSVHVKAESCAVNEATADPLEVTDSSMVSIIGKINSENSSESVKEEDCIVDRTTKEEPSDSDFRSSSDSEEDEEASNSMENSKQSSIADQLLQFAEIYEHYSLLWNLDSDENHDRSRQLEALRTMLHEVNDKMNLSLTLNQLRSRNRLLRKYHAADKRKRLKCEQDKIEFIPMKPLLYEKLQYLEPFVGPYRCVECNEEIAQYLQFQAHMAAHNGNAQYRCSICQKDFKNLNIMIAHKRRHTNEKQFVCTICGVSYYYIGELTAHQTIHTGEKKCICHVCGAAYRTVSLLNKHKNRRHNPDRPRYQCTQCPKSFKEKVALNGHMNTHLQVRNAVCPVCGKGFYIRKTLAQHMLIHDTVKKYQCDICEKKFAQKAGLCTHRRMQHNIVGTSGKLSSS